MGILRLLRRLISKEGTRPAPKSVDGTVRELQRKLMSAARDNGKPRIGA